MNKGFKIIIASLFFIIMYQFAVAELFKKERLIYPSIDSIINPLSVYSSEWSNAIYQNCNTAEKINYLNKDEKEMIWVLNMVRLNPQLFLKTVLLNPKCSFYKIEKNRNSYDRSLIKTLGIANPIKDNLFPDSSCFVSAHCHAYSSGIRGYVGHDRVNKECKQDFFGECCQYGYSNALSVIMSLLLDYNIPSLGHRMICLSEDYRLIGVSMQPHTKYEYNSVIDFK